MASFMPARARIVLIAAAVGVAAASVAQDRTGEVRSWQAAWQARQAQEAERLRAESLRREYERRRAVAHARMRAQPDTTYPSSPPTDDVMCPVASNPEAFRDFQIQTRERREEAFRRATGLPLRTGLSVHPVPKHAARPVRTDPLAMSASSHPSPATTVFASASSSSVAEPGHMVPLFPSASDPLGRQGFARVINHGDEAGEVTINAYDDQGTSHGPLTLTIDAGETIHFNSADLENGNAGKGLSGSTGPGEGDWRLELDSGLDIEVLSYIRTGDGFLTAMHDTAPEGDDGHRVAIFNPGSNTNQESLLRLVNRGDADASVNITGTDDKGMSPGDGATVALPAHSSVTYTAAELESGNAEGLTGSIGDGSGKWRLTVRSEQDIVAMSLLSSPTGHLTNLSTAPDNETDGKHSVPLFPSASDANGRQGFLRVVNHADEADVVTIGAFDDTDREYETLTLAIGANEAKHFNSDDLELGNAGKGLAGSTGAGKGDWRLELTSGLDIEVLAYIRTTDGFLTAIHDPAPRSAKRHRVAVFNPGSNANQVSVLRLVNADEEPAEVTVIGVDDRGMSPNEGVTITVPADRSVSYTAAELESGNANGLDSSLGDGSGKWRLTVNADRPIVAMSLLSSPTGHLTNLSTAPQRGAGPVETAEEAFEALISPIVQSKCVNCHMEGGQSGHTPLVFVKDADEDHLAMNLKEFRDYLAEKEDGAATILDKIRGARGHGGKDPVPAGTDGYVGFQRFMELLGAEVERSDVTVANLFEGVRFESPRRTLWRAAIVFAGRIPTDEEYSSIESGGEDALKRAIRDLMEGPGFHEFLIRGANDRLLTDRVLGSNHDPVPVNGYFVSFFREFSRREAETGTSDEASHAFDDWAARSQFGAARAPLELIAYVVEEDLPYTEILTADYVMANAWVAKAYEDDSVAFADSADPHEFKPSRIHGYYRKGENYPGDYALCRVAEESPADCDDVLETNWPHAGILNTLSFLHRYPTTATNRNRARSRWTYYHFLGDDIENSESRTMDPDVLKDTNNPTLHNPACNVCHARMDPVAGAFQNYGNAGLYRDQPGGLDSLAATFKGGLENQHLFSVEARSWEERESFTVANVRLYNGTQDIAFATRSSHNILVDHVTVRSSDGAFSRRYELEDVEDETCGTAWELDYEVVHCPVALSIEVPSDGDYDLETEAYVGYDYAEVSGQPATLALIVPYYYRKGDIWYGDMREPGFSGVVLPDDRDDDSLQWLAGQIIRDERFATSVVKFWWPAIMGAEVAEQPQERGDVDYEARQLASDGQAEEVRLLADGFRRGFAWSGEGPYNLKDLLTEMAASKWFRAKSFLDGDGIRAAALRDAGSRRLLTPEELARKTASVTGYQWGRGTQIYEPRPHTAGYSALTDEARYRLFYGGIDSDGITERARDLTSVMAGVAQRHAAESSCPIVFREFYLLADGERRLFEVIDTSTTPTSEPDAEGSTGEARIKAKIASLQRKLFGIDADVDSVDVQTTYDLFVEVWQRKRNPELLGFLEAVPCELWQDHGYYDGILDDTVVTVVDGSLRFQGWDYDLVNEFLRGVDDEDALGVARTWVVTLAYLLMDYRYLYL